MPELSIETLLLFAVFVAPGLVALRVFRLFVPTERVETAATLLTALTYSMVNYALTFWLVDIAITGRGWTRAALLVLVVLISPTLLAVATYLLRTSRFLGRWLDHPAPTGWDFFFLQRKPCWVLFHLRSGAKVGGWYGPKSRASLYPFDQEMYVESVWRLDEDGKFLERVPETGGAIVRFADCEVIEFFAEAGGG